MSSAVASKGHILPVIMLAAAAILIVVTIALGAWLGGYVFDTTGSYDLVWWMAVALGVAAAALHFPIKERPVARLAVAET